MSVSNAIESNDRRKKYFLTSFQVSSSSIELQFAEKKYVFSADFAYDNILHQGQIIVIYYTNDIQSN